MRLRVGVAQIDLTVGDLDGNVGRIVAAAGRARDMGCDVVVFPELAVTGYPPEDLLLKPAFVADAAEATTEVAKAVPDIVQIVGTVHRDGDLYNAAVVCVGGEIIAHYAKCHLPNYGVFDEKRYFKSSSDPGPLFRLHGVTFGVTVCEDVWVPDGPLLHQSRAGCDLAININGSPYHHGKLALRRAMLSTRASDAAMPLVFLNLVGGQDELVFDGASMLFDAEGTILASAPQFEESVEAWDVDCTDAFRRRLRDTRIRSLSRLELSIVDLDDPAHGLVPRDEAPPLDPASLEEPGIHGKTAMASEVVPAQMSPLVVREPLDDVSEVYAALVLGVRDYLAKNGFPTGIVGLSGGIDSSLTAAVAVDALGPENVTGVAMPSPYSSEGSIADARTLTENLGIAIEIIPIDAVFQAMLDALAPVFAGTESDVTEENLQARIRGSILMAHSNKFGAILLTTGNKSEMAVGYATLYGDMAGGFAVLKDVPKTLVYALSRHRNECAGFDVIPESVLAKPPSAELAPGQLDQDTLPPYQVLDPILEAYVERDMVAGEIVAAGIAPRDVVESIVRMVDRSEYKRRQAAPGVRITPKAFGRDRRLPITNRYIAD